MKLLRNLTVVLLIAGLGVLSFTLMSAKPAHVTSIGFLRGTFVVRCPYGHDDIVEDITRNHDCEKCDAKAVDDGSAFVVCPDGHATHVEGITESHLCTFRFANGTMCGKQCRR